MPLVGTPWWVGSRVTEHLSLIMDSSSSKRKTRVDLIVSLKNLTRDEDGTRKKRARNESTSSDSLCNDRYFILSATGDFHQSLSSVSPFLLGKALKTQAGSISEVRKLGNGTVLAKVEDAHQAAVLQQMDKITQDW